MNTVNTGSRSRWAIVALAALCVAGAAEPSHAMFGFLKFMLFKPKREVREVTHQGVLEGQKVHVFELHHSNASDLEAPLQGYMDGTKSGGSLVIDPTKNAFIVTDTPENLDRMQRLISSMDIAYSNPNADARQILITQQMMKAIRALGPLASASPNVSRSIPGMPVNVTPVGNGGPVGIFHPDSEDEKQSAKPQWRVLEDRPSIGGFRVLGWVRDSRGTIVVLMSSEGQRYMYREGHLVEGRSFTTANYVPGISGSLNGDMLTLQDGKESKVSLHMIPQVDRIGAHP